MFTTDLKLSYGKLSATKEKLKSYYEALDEVEVSLKAFDEFLGEQTSSSIMAFRNSLSGTDGVLELIQAKSLAAKALYALLSRYITAMSGIVGALNDDEITRVDPPDIDFNIGQIRVASNTLTSGVSTSCAYAYTAYGVANTTTYEADEQERQKMIRNYTKLENIRTQTLVPAANTISSALDEIERIYNESFVPFETTDDQYENEAEALYDAHPKAFHKWENLFGDIASVTWSFLKTLAIGVAVAAACILVPELAILAFVVLAAGAAYVAAAPEEYVPEGMYDLRKALRGGPVEVAEYIGQSVADTAQSPEGIASLTADAVTLPFGGVFKITGKGATTLVQPVVKSAISKTDSMLNKAYFKFSPTAPADTWKQKVSNYYRNRRIYDNEKFSDQNTGKEKWPEEEGVNKEGFVGGRPDSIGPFKEGEKFDRYGKSSGGYMAPYGFGARRPFLKYSIRRRSLLPGGIDSDTGLPWTFDRTEYHVYKVTKDVPSSLTSKRSGEIAPWAGRDPKGATQVGLDRKPNKVAVQDLIDGGYLKEVTPPGDKAASGFAIVDSATPEEE